MAVQIVCRGLWKTYYLEHGEFHALSEVSLDVEEGEWVAIQGRSGSGKSTLLNILSCLDTPTRGTYALAGRDASRLDQDALAEIRNRYIGFVFQNFNLLPRTSAIENVQLPLMYAGISAKEQRMRALQAIERVGMLGREYFYPSQLSGGQQQRVAIARALVTNPSIVLADEPTGNLDSHSSFEIVHLLKSLHEEGRTILLVTHEADIADLAPRRILMKDGRIQSDVHTSAGLANRTGEYA